jgi:hypothetical protein
MQSSIRGGSRPPGRGAHGFEGANRHVANPTSRRSGEIIFALPLN